MKFVVLQALLAFYIQVVFCINTYDIVKEAKSHIGETKWSFDSNYGTGRNTSKSHLFVFDVLQKVGAFSPERTWGQYSPIGAEEWGDPNSDYLKNDTCWNARSLQWGCRYGDIISNGKHVAIITGGGLTTSARSDMVVEDNGGLRKSGTGSRGSITACWHYSC